MKTTKVFYPKSEWVYGSFKKNKAMRGSEQNANLSNIGSKISMLIDDKKVHGTPEERRCLVNVYQITYSDLHINVVFRKATPLKHKLWIRQWLIANNFSFRDKPYVWKEGVSTSTKQIGLGPWSKKPWANGKNAHSTKATWNQK